MCTPFTSPPSLAMNPHGLPRPRTGSSRDKTMPATLPPPTKVTTRTTGRNQAKARKTATMTVRNKSARAKVKVGVGTTSAATRTQLKFLKELRLPLLSNRKVHGEGTLGKSSGMIAPFGKVLAPSRTTRNWLQI